ncbi:hypothetical protein ACLOJK_002536 [Asimina triloba]
MIFIASDATPSSRLAAGRSRKRKVRERSISQSHVPVSGLDCSSSGQLYECPVQYREEISWDQEMTFTQLKEEEHLLLEERMELNKVWYLPSPFLFPVVDDCEGIQKLEGLQVARNDLSMKNENLKKLKMNLESQLPEESRVTSDSPPAKGGFVLPDLNLPAEDESAFQASTE